MKTAEEKARELVKQYYNYVSGWTSTNKPDEYPSAQYEGEMMKVGRAKQCALITCDEILNGSNIIGARAVSRRKYWYEVRDAINAL